VSPAPDRAQREAARNLDLAKRMREVEEAILARAPEHELQPSLDRIRAVMELLGDPQRTFPVVHLTGTNGKTSTTRIIEALLRELGLRTGRFTSPHLHSMRERIALSGKPIDTERFLAAYDEVLPLIELVDNRSAAEGGPRMTYFEVLVAVAYAAFADAPVDVAVVEVGLDVPEAGVMVIEHADRLGLAQLHQLRGRVGRAGQAAHCFVVADREEIGPEAQARLEAFVRERDGFALAEADLRQRGPGEFFGTRQAGLDGFQVGSLTGDLRVLEEARAAAAAALRDHPDLDGPWAAVRAAMEARWTARLELGRIG